MKNLVERFFETRKMMSRMALGGGMPGMPGVPEWARGGAPAEAAEEGQGQAALRQPDEAQAAGAGEPPAAPLAAQNGGAFGLPQQGGQDFELPDEFKKFMG